ncbi:hypothetical protein, partial [Mesorhizobium sp. M7A.F.Ca.CA.001.09.2.1]|uniref:hypothetical protein n=1 Tax=Mesorhizobium sp. M7A.F.Ca.CA.001.09.2.1 TaxID=2496719 RepID=UPI0019D167F7
SPTRRAANSGFDATAERAELVRCDGVTWSTASEHLPVKADSESNPTAASNIQVELRVCRRQPGAFRKTLRSESLTQDTDEARDI